MIHHQHFQRDYAVKFCNWYGFNYFNYYFYFYYIINSIILHENETFFKCHMAPVNLIDVKSRLKIPVPGHFLDRTILAPNQMSIPVVYSCKLSIFGPKLVWIWIFFNLISKVSLIYLVLARIHKSISGEMWI